MAYSVYLAAYAPSSPHRLQDLAKLAYSMKFVDAFIAVKPTGMAAQVGVPEVFRLAYKLDRRFLVLPRLSDIKELIKVDNVVFIVHSEEAPDICQLYLEKEKSVALVVQAGETPFTKEDLAMGSIVRVAELEGYRSPNPVAEAAIALVKLSRVLDRGFC